MKKEMNKTVKITITALLLATGIILPRITGMIPIPQINSMISPMHFPVFIIGLLLGGQYAVLLAIMLPLTSYLLTGMPPLFPVGISMICEMATYGLVVSYLYNNKNMNIYLSLILAMIAGRITMGIVNTVLLSQIGAGYTLQIFITSAFIKAIPGIIVQLIAIPPLVQLINNRMSSKEKKKIVKQA